MKNIQSNKIASIGRIIHMSNESKIFDTIYLSCDTDNHLELFQKIDSYKSECDNIYQNNDCNEFHMIKDFKMCDLDILIFVEDEHLHINFFYMGDLVYNSYIQYGEHEKYSYIDLSESCIDDSINILKSIRKFYKLNDISY